MEPILKKISTLPAFDIHIFFMELLEKRGLRSEFFSLMETMIVKERTEFWDSLCQLGKLWLKEEFAAAQFSLDGQPPENIDESRIKESASAINGLLEDLESLVETARKERDGVLQDIITNREILKARMPDFLSDQYMGVPMPSPVKEYPGDSRLIELPEPSDDVVRVSNIFQCIKQRKSHRKFTEDPLSLAELSYLLWATQGVRQFFPEKKGSFRNVPSGGARHPMETYLAINHVDELEPGIYRYLPFEHALVFQSEVSELKEKLAKFSFGQRFVGWCAVCFIWTAIPYRIEWRYGPEAKKDILQEAGHICQNLYLTCESIGCGTCGINAYNQEKIDEMIQVDGVDEMTVYLSPVGRVAATGGIENS